MAKHLHKFNHVYSGCADLNVEVAETYNWQNNTHSDIVSINGIWYKLNDMPDVIKNISAAYMIARANTDKRNASDKK